MIGDHVTGDFADCRVLIAGCGAIGGLYGAHIARVPGVEVFVYDPSRDVVDALNGGGVRVSGLASFQAPVRAVSDAALLPACDFAIVATKAYQTKDAALAIAPSLLRGVACSFQNGLGNEETLAEHIPSVLMGASFLGGHTLAPGVIAYDTTGASRIGAFSPSATSDETVSRFAALLAAAGLGVEVYPGIKGAKWGKVIFNCAANPVCALTNLPFGAAYSAPDLRVLMEGIAREGVELARRLGIELGSDPIADLEHALSAAANHEPSMMTDLRSKRRTEIDALNGALLRFSDIDMPLNRIMFSLIKGVEASWR